MTVIKMGNRNRTAPLEGLPPEDLWVTDVVRPSQKFDRLLRQDPPTQLGVPSQDLAVVALQRGNTHDAIALVQYMVLEYEIVHNSVLNGWLDELLSYALVRLEATTLGVAMRVPRKHFWDAFLEVGRDFSVEVIAAMERGDAETAVLLLDHVRRVFKNLNDETVRFVQDILTALDDVFGEDEPILAQRGPYLSIWRERYRDWESLTSEEQLQLRCEGMRTHFGGPSRHGEFLVIDEPDQYRMVFTPCGTGGILRHGDPETGEGPWPTTGVNRTPKPYTYDQKGVPWYCTHCSLYLEHWAAEDHGFPLRPVIFDADPNIGVTWLIRKSRQTSADQINPVRIGVRPDQIS
jgi:hypothetical protein